MRLPVTGGLLLPVTAGLARGQAPASQRPLTRVWGLASPRLCLGVGVPLPVSGRGQLRGEAYGAGVGLAWPSPCLWLSTGT